jgi:hypothetical protein
MTVLRWRGRRQPKRSETISQIDCFEIAHCCCMPHLTAIAQKTCTMLKHDDVET